MFAYIRAREMFVYDVRVRIRIRMRMRCVHTMHTLGRMHICACVNVKDGFREKKKNAGMCACVWCVCSMHGGWGGTVEKGVGIVSVKKRKKIRSLRN